MDDTKKSLTNAVVSLHHGNMVSMCAQESFGNIDIVGCDLTDYPYVRYLNLFAVRGEGKTLFVDTGLEGLGMQAWFENEACLSNASLEDCMVFLTHAHPDHAGEVKWFSAQGAAVYAHEEVNLPLGLTDEQLRALLGVAQTDREAVFGDVIGEHKRNLENCVGVRFYSGEVSFDIGEKHFKSCDLPGHMYGHKGLLEPEQGILFAGDYLSKTNRPIISSLALDDHDIMRHLSSLDDLIAKKLTLLLTTHFKPVVGTDKIRAWLKRQRKAYLSDIERVLDIVRKVDGRCTPYAVSCERAKNDNFFKLPKMGEYTRILYTQKAFAELEYLFDVGKVERRLDDDGAAVYVPHAFLYEGDGRKEGVS